MNDNIGDQHDPVAADIAKRDPETGDAIAGEQVLDGELTGDKPVAPHPDDLRRPRSDGDEPRREETGADGPRHRESRSAERVDAAPGDGGQRIASASGGDDAAAAGDGDAASGEAEQDRSQRHA